MRSRLTFRAPLGNLRWSGCTPLRARSRRGAQLREATNRTLLCRFPVRPFYICEKTTNRRDAEAQRGRESRRRPRDGCKNWRLKVSHWLSHRVAVSLCLMLLGGEEV